MVWTKNTKNKNGDSFKICTVTHNFIIELEFHYWICKVSILHMFGKITGDMYTFNSYNFWIQNFNDDFFRKFTYETNVAHS